MRAALLLATLTASAGPHFPALTDWVVDDGRVLSPSVETRLRDGCALLQRRTGHQLAVVTVRSLEGQPVERYSRALFTRWGVGRQGNDDGVGLLVAPAEHRVRIEVGRGLTGVLTNAKAAAILRNRILPAFREGRLAAGVLRGEAAILRALA